MAETPFDNLNSTDVAAATWRETWLRDAFVRGGKQVPPPGNWTQCVYVAGRGFGKTSGEINWQGWECYRVPNIIGHAVAPTLNDVRGTIMLGPAGYRSVLPAEILAGESWDQAYDATHHELHFKNGSMIRGFGAADQGGRLRGPQCHNLIGDELREWDRPAGNLEFVHTNAMLGCRLPYPDGTPARAVFGTTPKAIAYLKNLYRRPDVVVVRGSTYENLRNLSPSFANTILSLEGTQLGKAEIHGLDSDAEDGGIFKRNWFRLWPKDRPLPEFSFVLQTMDTAFEEDNYDPKKGLPDFSASAILGVFNTKQCFSDAELKRMGVRSKYAALLCDFWMERLGFPELVERTRQTYRTLWGSPGRRPDVVLIENKASGISLRQTLGKYSVPVVPFNPMGESKTMRAHAASPIALQGMFFVPESKKPDRKGLPRDWVEPLMEQMCSFSGEGSIEYDDGLDSMTQGLLYLSRMGTLEIKPQSLAYPDPDEKEEAELRRALALADSEKRRGDSPYGA